MTASRSLWEYITGGATKVETKPADPPKPASTVKASSDTESTVGKIKTRQEAEKKAMDE